MAFFSKSTFIGFAALLLVAAPLPLYAEPAEKPAAATLPACGACDFEPEARALEKLMRRYETLAAQGGWPVWLPGRKILPHDDDPRMPALRRILAVTGDDIGSAKSPSSPLTYDDALVAGVQKFQLRHGLNTDGVLGKATQEALSVPVAARILQIRATIARIRARSKLPEDRFILVNLPAYTLYAIRKGHTELAMRVIIGSRKNATPMFDNAVTDVVFNPQWHVPQHIAQTELLPKLRDDPGYFISEGFIITQDGVPVDPLHADLADAGRYRFRQQPGDENALGKIKFNIPDADGIYLHSTAAPALFAKDARALSHGCVRLEKPRELAHFILEASVKDWDKDRIDAAYDASKPRWVRVQAVPVHLVYWTAFADAAGTAYFFSDVYGEDAKLPQGTHAPKKPAP